MLSAPDAQPFDAQAFDAQPVDTQAVRFELLADAEPGLLSRVLGPFARRDLMPDAVRARRSGATVEASVDMHEMPSAVVHLVEGNLRQVVGVRRVSVVLLAGLRAAA